MELKINNHYHARIKKEAPSDFTIKELEKILREEEGLTIRWVLSEAELISFVYDDYKVRKLRKQLNDVCEFSLLEVTY